MAEPPMSSNNPFRRKHSTLPSSSAAATTHSPPGALLSGSSSELDLFPSADAESTGIPGDSTQQHYHLHPTGDEFRQQLRALSKSTEAPPSTTFIKPKIVKKVRVLSPPPSSPDSVDADFGARFPAHGPHIDAATETETETATATTTEPAATGIDDVGLFGDQFADGPPYDEYSSESEDMDEDVSAPLRGRSVDSAPMRLQRPVPNPFQKTAGEVRTAEGTATTPTVGKGSLDVDAFRRLLLTGQAGSGNNRSNEADRVTGGVVSTLQSDAASITDASSVSKHSILDTAYASQESPRTSHEISEAEDDRSGFVQGLHASASPRHILRKKPPPPSSRHGRLIHTEKKGTSSSSGTTDRPSSSSSDVNKPISAPLTRLINENAQGIFEREAVGKTSEGDVDSDSFDIDEAIPIPRPPTPPNTSHTFVLKPSHSALDPASVALASPTAPPPPLPTTTAPPVPSQPKKPAPPPRRQAAHGRTDSRVSTHERVSSVQSLASSEKSPTASRRSSIDSARSRSSSMKMAAHVPAPPPPRRPNHASRASISYIAASETPTAEAMTATVPPDPPTWVGSPSPVMKLAKPPPPPTRGVSVRKKEVRPAIPGRPSSALSTDSASRRLQPHAHQQPPPPPPPSRARGSSRGSVETPPILLEGGTTVTSRKVSNDKVDNRLVVESEGMSVDGSGPDNEKNSSSANSILADLDALQREVDALRGQYEK